MRITPKAIKEALDDKFDLDLSTKSRKTEYVFARAICYKLCKDLTRHSLTSIGEAFNRDHATVMHGLKLVDNHLNDYFFEDYRKIYNNYLSYFLKLSDDPEFVFLKKVNDIEKMKDAFLEEQERIETELRNEYKKEISKLKLKVKRYETHQFFSKIAELPHEDFVNLRCRINSFFAMNRKRESRLQNDKCKTYTSF